MSSLHRLDIEVRDDSVRRVTVDPELGDGTFSVAPLHNLPESGVPKRSLQGFEIVEKGTRVTVEKPINTFSSAFRLGEHRIPKGFIVSCVGFSDLPAVASHEAKCPSRLEQSMEFAEYRRAGLDREAIENVVRKDRRARLVVERQGASKIAPQIHRTSRPTIHVDPSWQDAIAASEVEQKPPLSAVEASPMSPSRMESTANANGPEDQLATDLL
jgi:hypothetical protein